MKKYNLTSSKGLLRAMKSVGYDAMASSPIISLAKYAIDVFSDATKSLETQRETAIKLINKGKEQGVDEMEITMDNKKGFKLNAPIDEGVNIDTMIGTDEKLVIKVKYKPDTGASTV